MSPPPFRKSVMSSVVATSWCASLARAVFGQVYVAERTDVPEHRVALKVMIKKVYAGRNVDRELVMLAAACHPHIVQLKDHGTTDKLVWLTMPLFEGETLEARLERKALTLREAHEIFVPIARGLQSLHDSGLRHQDVKPDNVFLAQFGGQLHPMLLDLGVAAEKDATFAAGTALFGAPEQFAALSGMGMLEPLSEKVDSYGLATTLLRSLVGPEHFPGEEANTPLEVANSFDVRENQPLAEGALEALSGPPRELLNDAFARWLRKSPAERPDTGELADQLDVLLAQEREATLAIQQSVAQQKTSLQRIRRAFAALLVLASVGALYGFSKRETLRLAGELDRARAQGAASFDKLDTCAAAHRLSQQQKSACELARDDEQSANKRTLSGIQRDKVLAITTLTKRADRNASRLRSCRDDAQATLAQHQEDETSWQTATAQQLRAFEGERATFRKSATQHAEQLNSCRDKQSGVERKERDCRVELKTSNDDNSSCQASLATVSEEQRRSERDKANTETAHNTCELKLLSCQATVATAPQPKASTADSSANTPAKSSPSKQRPAASTGKGSSVSKSRPAAKPSKAKAPAPTSNKSAAPQSAASDNGSKGT